MQKERLCRNNLISKDDKIIGKRDVCLSDTLHLRSSLIQNRINPLQRGDDFNSQENHLSDYKRASGIIIESEYLQKMMQ